MKGQNALLNKKAIYISLGCKLNFAENSAVSDLLEREGVHRAVGHEKADICIINTCTVTEVSNHKSRQAIHKAIRENPDAFVVVMGCYAQMNSKDLAGINGVDLVVGMQQKGDIVRLIKEKFPMHQASFCRGQINNALHQIVSTSRKEIVSFVPSCSKGTRTRYFIKIQDGCDYFCTYCAIPYARGRSRNGDIASLVHQAEEVAAQGGKEIVITGVNIGDFGKSTGETFFDLVQALDAVVGIQRYRISSIEPNLLTKEIIDYCSKSRAFMPHFHIPLQSGSDEILKLMHRRYDTQFFADKIHYIKEVIPDAFIGVDLIVGTRGETSELFEKAYEFVQSLDVAQYHVFSYSERPDTAALRIPYIVAETEKHVRSQRLITLSEEKRCAFYARYRGMVRTVLTEHAKCGIPVKGFTDNYIRVELPELYNKVVEGDNHLVKVQLMDFTEDKSALIGKIIKDDK